MDKIIIVRYPAGYPSDKIRLQEFTARIESMTPSNPGIDSHGIVIFYVNDSDPAISVFSTWMNADIVGFLGPGIFEFPNNKKYRISISKFNYNSGRIEGIYTDCDIIDCEADN